MMHLQKLLAAVVLFAVAVDVMSDSPRRMVPEDYHEFQFVSDPRLSPDGQWVVLVRSEVSEDRRSRESSLWRVSADGSGEPHRFTAGNSDRLPRFSPDGSRLALVRTEDDQAQLHIMPIDGGEARAISRLQQGSINDHAWLSDGESILLTLTVDPTVEDPTQAEEEEGSPAADVRVFSRQLYQAEGRGWIDERRRTLWQLDVETGDMRRLAADPEWNVNSAAVSPNGQLVVFTADFTEREFDGGFEQGLHLLDVETGAIDPLETPPGRAGAPAFSPDGERIAFTHQAERYAPVQVKIMDRSTQQTEVLQDGMAFSASRLIWPPGAERPLVQADYRGSRPLLALDAEGEETVLVGQDASISAVDFDRSGRLVWIENSASRLDEVWTMADHHEAPQGLTAFNDDLLEQLHISDLEHFVFMSDGVEVDGFLLRPKGFDDSQRWPLVLNIKGGPSVMWGHQWMQEFQMMAGAGYAVVFTNYRGSSGYGHEFQSAARLDYGGVDYRDNMALVDDVLDRFDWVDSERLFVTGGSHGGFLTNWITTRTDRFAAAVTQRSVSNWISEAGTQSYPPAAMNEEFGGSLWQNFDLYWDRSPLQFADQVRTPTLIIHSTNDRITPLGQGQEWFYALLNQDIETELAIFEGEGHGLSRGGTPVNLVKRLELILDWFERFDPATGED